MTGKVAKRSGSGEREALKRYLGQYYRAGLKLKQLNRRLANIAIEKRNPIRGKRYSSMPNSITNREREGPAAVLLIRQEEIGERVAEQEAVITKTMLAVMEIMDFLPVDSIERTILEYRHIDLLGWDAIGKEMHLTRTPCNEYYNKALDKLLEFRKIQVIVKRFIGEEKVILDEQLLKKRGDVRRDGGRGIKKDARILHTDMLPDSVSPWKHEWLKHSMSVMEQ